MDLDTSGWSGDGDFTALVLSVLGTIDEVVAARVEDAPAGGSGAGYQFLANEVFVTFATVERRVRRWSRLPLTRRVRAPQLTLAGLGSRLSAVEEVGPPDYADEGMLQYLRAERVVQPYQTRGYKLVELLRLYEAGQARGGG